MEGFLIRAVVVGIGLWLASKIVSGIAFSSTETLIAAALLLGIVNAFVRPVIVLLTLPITLLTLGLFLLVINALMIMLVAWFLPGFLVAGFWSAVFAAIVVSQTSRSAADRRSIRLYASPRTYEPSGSSARRS